MRKRFLVIVLPLSDFVTVIGIDRAAPMNEMKFRFFVGTLSDDGHVEPLEECVSRLAAFELCDAWNVRERETDPEDQGERK